MITTVVFDIGKVLIGFDWDRYMRELFDEETAVRVTGAMFGGGDWKELDRAVLSEEEVLALVDRIRKYVSETKYSCSVGYSYRSNKEKTVDDLVKESDVMMYQEKSLYYQQSGIDRRIL